jgi:hypothetical protein
MTHPDLLACYVFHAVNSSREYPTYSKDSQVKTYIHHLHVFADEVLNVITMNIIPVII